jgi:hypothetical protein
LDEDDRIFSHRSERSNQPRKVRDDVLLLHTVEQNLECMSAAMYLEYAGTVDRCHSPPRRRSNCPTRST